jgi:hypothetical protein
LFFSSFFLSRQTLKPGALVMTRQSVVVTKQDNVVIRNGYTPSSGNDIDKLHAQLNPTDVELLYSRLPVDVISTVDYQESLTEDQQLLHAKLIDGELERQDDDSYEQ